MFEEEYQTQHRGLRRQRTEIFAGTCERLISKLLLIAQSTHSFFSPWRLSSLSDGCFSRGVLKLWTSSSTSRKERSTLVHCQKGFLLIFCKFSQQTPISKFFREQRILMNLKHRRGTFVFPTLSVPLNLLWQHRENYFRQNWLGNGLLNFHLPVLNRS